MPSTSSLVSVVKTLMLGHLQRRLRPPWTIAMAPDLAAWRGPSRAIPDWVCVISPATEQLADHARRGIEHVWVVDPRADTLHVLRLDGDTYRFVASYREEEAARIVPFGDVELDVTAFWHW